METRLRLILVLRGLPRPQAQYPVLDNRRRRAVWLDLAYPEHRIGIEYEGADHTRPERVLRDAGRYTWLVDDGWRKYRFTKYEVYREPDEIAATVDRALGVRSTGALRIHDRTALTFISICRRGRRGINGSPPLSCSMYACPARRGTDEGRRACRAVAGPSRTTSARSTSTRTSAATRPCWRA